MYCILAPNSHSDRSLCKILNPPPHDVYMGMFMCVLTCQTSVILLIKVYFPFSAEYIWSEEWSTFGGHAYKFFSDGRVTFPEARDACRVHGGLLVSINSPEEQDFIKNSVLKKRALSAFTGGTDRTNGSFSIKAS